jgi:hypothetical protein
MARGRGGRSGSRVSGALAPLLGAAVLVVVVRAVESTWVRARGVPASEESSTGARLTHAVLLSSALSLARRFGLPRA